MVSTLARKEATTAKSCDAKDIESGLSPALQRLPCSRPASSSTVPSKNMALSLLDLPNEVLAQIFSHLDTSHLRPCDWDPETEEFTGEEYTNSRPSLCAVTLVNHRLHHIARRILLEDISIHIGSSGPRYRPGFEYDAVRFTQHCTEHPVILEHLKKCHVWWYAPTPDEWASNFFDTVSLGSNLTVLNIEKLQDYTASQNRLAVLENLVHRLQFLEVLVANIDEICIPYDFFLEICGMRHLRSFETDCPILASDSKREASVGVDNFFEDIPVDCAQELKLEKLRCTGEYVDLAVLRHVLQRSPRLKRLILSLPGPGLHTYDGLSIVPGGFKTKTLGQLFRPDLVSRMLMPCASSLRELTITNEIMQLSQTNGTMIDLSSFSNLRRLTLSNRLICKVTNQGSDVLPSLALDPPGKEWHKSLPVGLEFLQVQFDCMRGLLWNLVCLRLLENEYNTEWISGDIEANTKAYAAWHSDFERIYFKPSVGKELLDAAFHQLSWIMDLARDVSSRLQLLSSIKVVENVTVQVDDCGSSWDLLDLVKAYPNAFRFPGLDLELSVRVPHGYVPPPLESMRNQSSQGSSEDAAVPLSQAELLQALSAQESRRTVASRLWASQISDMSTTGWGDDE